MTSSSSPVTAPSVTTTVAGEMLVGLFGMADGRPTFTPPSGMTERFDVNSGSSSGTASEGTDAVQAAAGSTGARTATATNAADSIGQLIALTPEALTINPEYRIVS